MVQVAETGANEMVVTAAVDSWALGVMAYELLTREEAFPVVGGPQTVSDPWPMLP